MNKAINRKLQINFENVLEKGKGQCLVAQLNLVHFNDISSSLLKFYKDCGTIKPATDKQGVHVETKISVALVSKLRIHLTLYCTINKIMVQGSKAAVRWSGGSLTTCQRSSRPVRPNQLCCLLPIVLMIFLYQCQLSHLSHCLPQMIFRPRSTYQYRVGLLSRCLLQLMFRPGRAMWWRLQYSRQFPSLTELYHLHVSHQCMYKHLLLRHRLIIFLTESTSWKHLWLIYSVC